VSAEQRKREGYEQQADETIAGQKCEVWKHTSMDVTYWLWNNIDLKLINHSLGKNGYTKTAVKAEANVSIPASLLQAPAGYVIK
jgi:hypothetical protein